MAEQKKSAGRKEFEAQIVKKAWKDPKFKKDLLANPKSVLEKELQSLHKGAKMPASIKVKVVEETADTIYLVLPRNPKEVSGKELSDSELEAVAGGTITVVGVGIAAVTVNTGANVNQTANGNINVNANVNVQVNLSVQTTTTTTK
jgi:hypothetical protein